MIVITNKAIKSDQTMTAIKRFYHGAILLNETFIVLKIRLKEKKYWEPHD